MSAPSCNEFVKKEMCIRHCLCIYSCTDHGVQHTTKTLAIVRVCVCVHYAMLANRNAARRYSAPCSYIKSTLCVCMLMHMRFKHTPARDVPHASSQSSLGGCCCLLADVAKNAASAARPWGDARALRSCCVQCVISVRDVKVYIAVST